MSFTSNQCSSFLALFSVSALQAVIASWEPRGGEPRTPTPNHKSPGEQEVLSSRKQQAQSMSERAGLRVEGLKGSGFGV